MATPSNCAIYLVTYDRGKDYRGQTKPYHWEFHFETGRPGSGNGVAHQLHGMPGAFYYSGPEPVDIWTSENSARGIKNTLEIGRVPRDDLDGLEDLLRAIPITVDEASDWNCQSWGGEAISRLIEKGWVDAQYSFAVVKEWMKEE